MNNIHKTKLFQYIVLFGLLFLFVRRMGCPLQKFCGLPCPGCNMSTALYYVFHLDFKKALFYHPLVFVLLLCIGIGIRLYSKYQSLEHRYIRILVYGFVVVFLGVYVYRMITIFPNVPMVYVQDNFIYKLYTLFF